MQFKFFVGIDVSKHALDFSVVTEGKPRANERVFQRASVSRQKAHHILQNQNVARHLRFSILLQTFDPYGIR